MLVLLRRDWSRACFCRKITIEVCGHRVLQAGLIVLVPVEETWRGFACEGLCRWRAFIVLAARGALDHGFEQQAPIIPVNVEAGHDVFLGLR